MARARRIGDFVPIIDDEDTTSYSNDAATFTFTGKASEQFLVFGIGLRGSTTNRGRSLLVTDWRQVSAKYPAVVLDPPAQTVGTLMQFIAACGDAQSTSNAREFRPFVGEEQEFVRLVAQIAHEAAAKRHPDLARVECDRIAAEYLHRILGSVQAAAGTLNVSAFVIGGEGSKHEIDVTDLSGGNDAVPGLTLYAVSLGESQGGLIAPGFHAAPVWFNGKAALTNLAAESLSTSIGGTLHFTQNHAKFLRHLANSGSVILDSNANYTQAVLDASFVEEDPNSALPPLGINSRRGAPLGAVVGSNGEPPQGGHANDLGWGQELIFTLRKGTTSAGNCTAYMTRHMQIHNPDSVAEGDRLLMRMGS